MKRISAVIVFVAIFALASSVQAEVSITTDSETVPDFQPSLQCAKCHLEIHNYWKDSLHAQAIDDNIFEVAFMMALKQRGDSVRKLCLTCHSPTTAMTKDYMMELPITSEAIVCDFCHRITSVDLDLVGGQTLITITSGNDKHGPIAPSMESEAHLSVQSALFRDAKLCAACHQWTNESGLAIFDTYREWLNGPFPAQGIHCQNCHMPLVEGTLVTGKPQKMGEKINSHNLAGGHSLVQVASAAKIRIASVTRVAGGIRAIVEVSNVGSGHMIPTGLPSRALSLEVALVDSNGAVIETDTHEFKRTILDDEHNELTVDADIILSGAMVSKDNRIPPGETVKTSFDFAASPEKRYLVRATLRYKYKPLLLKEEEVTIEMGSDTKGL